MQGSIKINYVKIRNEKFREFGENPWVGNRIESHLFLNQLPYVKQK